LGGFLWAGPGPYSISVFKQQEHPHLT